MKHLLLLLSSILLIMKLQLSAQNSEKQKQWNDFEKNFPCKNIVKWNPETNAPKRVVDNNIFLSAKSNQKDNAEKHI